MRAKTKKTKAKTKAAGEAVWIPEQRTEREVKTREIAVAAIRPSPFQPRQDFPEEEIDRLAASIAESGLVHPVAVRPVPGEPGQWELVDGERRLRATRRLGLATIRAEVGEYSDAEVMQLVVATAVQRADLNPIEEALAFRRAIEAGVAEGPTELARQLGVSQGHVSNRIRLLELPAEWQGRVISGEIPPTHARAVLKYSAYPAILQEVAADLANEHAEIFGCRCSVDTFEHVLGSIAHDATKPLSGDYWEGGRRVPVFTPTPEQREQLQVIEVRYGWNGQQEEERAANVELWEQVQEEFLVSRDAKAEKKAAKAEAKKPAKEMTAAERKAAVAEERKKAKERAEQFAKRLYEWHLDWLRYLIARRIREDATIQGTLVIAVYARNVHVQSQFSPLEGLKDACKAHAPDVKVESKKSWYGTKIDAIASLVQIGESEIEAVLGQTMAEWFWRETDGPVEMAYPEDLEPLAHYLAVDRREAWTREHAGPLTESYWNLHSKDQLVELARELEVDVDGAAKKTDLVAALMKSAGGELPKELVAVKRPK